MTATTRHRKPILVETGGHSPPVVVFAGDDDLPFLFGKDAEGAPPLVLRMGCHAALHEALRNAKRAPRIPGVRCPFPTVTLDARDVDALVAAAEAYAEIDGDEGR